MMRYLIVTLLLLLCAPRVIAQTGLKFAPAEEVKKLKAWQPDPDYGVSSSFAVDLRPYMPPVGHQSMNDCTAWAAAYSIKTYLEVRDQGWRPNHPSRIFSPLFVYNQINKGQDKGSLPYDALQLMKRHGAATLATAPYQHKNYTRQPNQAALREAAQFRIHDFHGLKNFSQMRAALAQGHPILIGAKLTHIFSEGYYSVYTKEMHLRGLKNHDPAMPHAYHAMAVVGYDDTKRAFLVMNSWGKKWGQAGYCWVSYDLMQEVDVDMRNQNGFIFRAYIMIDERRRIRQKKQDDFFPDQDEKKKPEIISQIRDRYLGLNKQGKSEWFMTTQLQTGLNHVRSVTWNIKHQDGSIHLKKESSRGFNGYQIGLFLHKAGKYTITAKITRIDGSEMSIYTSHELKAPKRNLKIMFLDRYYAKGEYKGKRGEWWRYFVWLDGDRSQLTDIAQVRWLIYENNHKPWKVEYTRKGKDALIWMKGAYSAASTVYAYVTFIDGSTAKFSRVIRPHAPKRDKMVIQHSYSKLYISKDGSRKSTLNWIEGPFHKMKQIKVVFYWDPRINDWITIKYTHGQLLYSFPAFTTGYVKKVVIRYQDGTEERLNSEGWVTGLEKLPSVGQ